MRTGRRLLLVVSGWLVAAAASAQFVQYTTPGTHLQPPEATQERLDAAMESARWRLGRLLLHPWLELRDVGYIDRSARTDKSVLTATVGAGLRAYLPAGSRWTWAAHVLPEYVWYDDRDEQQRLNGRYGVGLFGNYGRIGLELTAARVEEARFFSREFEERVNVRDDRGAVSLQVDLGRGISLFGLASLLRVRFLDLSDESLPPLELTDRDEEILRAGVRMELPRGWVIGLGVEQSQVDFEVTDSPRSNSGTSPVVELRFDGSDFTFRSDVAWRSLESDSPTDPWKYDSTSGHALAAWRPVPPVELELYGRRNPVYSYTATSTYFEDTTLGVGVRSSLGRLANIRLFAEQGRDDYVAFAPGTPERRDDFDTLGGELGWKLGPLTLLVRGSETQYDSNQSQFDRTVTVIQSSLILRRGGSESPWW
ncbi:MAG: hypothetical protein GY856_21740 [bacterium]|nr:hypothetical protein [bacterium]